jgi:hypothetical protein
MVLLDLYVSGSRRDVVRLLMDSPKAVSDQSRAFGFKNLRRSMQDDGVLSQWNMLEYHSQIR